VSRLVFDWSAPWVQGCEAATLVEEVALTTGFRKPPYNDLFTVRAWPTLWPPSPAPKVRVPRKRSVGGGHAARADASDDESPSAPIPAETGERPAQRPRTKGRKSGNVPWRNEVDAAVAYVPPPPTFLRRVGLNCVVHRPVRCMAAWRLRSADPLICVVGRLKGRQGVP